LAATWRPAEGKPGKLALAIFADGVRIGSSFPNIVTPEAGWTGTELLIPADSAGMFVDELRVSDVARYDASFDLPTAPFEADEHTSVLCHFEGDGVATVFGREVALGTN